MKKIALILFGFVFAFAISSTDSDAIDSILKTVPKNSAEYSLDMLYAKKIKTLKFHKEKLDISLIQDALSYLKAFKKIIEYQKFLLTSDGYFRDLKKKLDILSERKSATQKLEYLYYQKLIQIGHQKEEYLKNSVNIYKQMLYDKTAHINFPQNLSIKNIKLYQKKLQNIEKKLETLKIDLEKWKIAEDEKSIAYINSLIKNTLLLKKSIIQKITDSYLMIFFDYIKSEDKRAFKIEKKIEKLLFKSDKKAYILLLNYYEKRRFGSAELFINNALLEVRLFFEKAWSVLNYPLFNIDDKNISLINFFIFSILILIGLYIGKYYKKSIYGLKKKYDINNSTTTLLANIGYYIILTIAFLSSLKSIGLNLGSLTVIAGALSVGIGFGLQNVVSNFVSGIILMFEKSIKIGDYIQLDEQTRGTVTDIRMRSLTIRTNDNIDLIVPNQNFIQNIVTNWTLNDKSRRFRIPFGVAYGEDIQTVEKVILDALKQMKLPHYKIGSKKPQIILSELGDSSINLELFVWVKDDLTLRPRYTKSEFLKLIYKTLNEAGIDIPFPQQDIYIKELPSP